MQNVHMFSSQLRFDLVTAFLRCNISLERLHAVDRLNWKQIHCNNRTFHGHLFHSHLGPLNSEANKTNVPSSWSCAQIDKHMGF